MILLLFILAILFVTILVNNQPKTSRQRLHITACNESYLYDDVCNFRNLDSAVIAKLRLVRFKMRQKLPGTKQEIKIYREIRYIKEQRFVRKDSKSCRLAVQSKVITRIKMIVHKLLEFIDKFNLIKFIFNELEGQEDGIDFRNGNF